jgi:hypothetical protein
MLQSQSLKRALHGKQKKEPSAQVQTIRPKAEQAFQLACRGEPKLLRWGLPARARSGELALGRRVSSLALPTAPLLAAARGHVGCR